MSRVDRYVAPLRSASFLVFVGRLLRLVSGVLAMSVLSRVLDRETYGSFGVLWTLYLMLAPLLDAGFSATLAAVLPRHPSEKQRATVYGAFAVLSAVALVLAAVVILVRGPLAAHLGVPLLDKALVPFALFLPAAAGALIAEGVFLGLGKPALAGGLVALQSVLRLGGIAGGALVSGTLPGVCMGLAVASWIGLLTQLVASIVVIGRPRFLADAQHGFHVLRMGGLLTVASGLSTLSSQLDRLILTVFCGPLAVAVYVSGALENPAAALIAGSISASLMPSLSATLARGDVDAAAALVRNGVATAARFLYPALALSLLAAPQIVTLLFSDKYVAASSVFMIYALMLPLRCWTAGLYFVAARRSAVVLQGVLILLAVNGTAGVLLVPTFGPVGAACGTVAANYAVMTFYALRMYRGTGMRARALVPVRALARTALATAGAAVPALLIPAPSGTVPYLALVGGVFAVAYALLDRVLPALRAA